MLAAECRMLASATDRCDSGGPAFLTVAGRGGLASVQTLEDVP